MKPIATRVVPFPPTLARGASPTLYIEHASWRQRPGSPGPRPTHVHDVYHIVAVVAGSGSFLLGAGPVAVQAPYLVLTAPGLPHTFKGTPGDSTVYSELTFHARDARGAILRLPWDGLLRCCLGGDPPRTPVYAACSAALADAIDSLAWDLTGLAESPHPQAEGLARGLVDAGVFAVYRHLAEQSASTHRSDPVERIRQRLRDAHHPPLADLAREAGLDPKHLARAFRQRFGLPPVQYRQRVMVERAAVLLRSTDLPLEEVAITAGFEDPAYFNRLFARLIGEPPGRWRRRHLGGEG